MNFYLCTYITHIIVHGLPTILSTKAVLQDIITLPKKSTQKILKTYFFFCPKCSNLSVLLPIGFVLILPLSVAWSTRSGAREEVGGTNPCFYNYVGVGLPWSQAVPCGILKLWAPNVFKKIFRSLKKKHGQENHWSFEDFFIYSIERGLEHKLWKR